MQARNEDWARSYARQALSDLDAREALVQASSKKCHRLHFLQMAAEKVCKAHLLLTRENVLDSVRKRHAVVEASLPTIARQIYALRNQGNEIPQWEISGIRKLSHQIEVLSPACYGGDFRNDNSEYPWEDGKGNVCTPCEYGFPNIDDGSRDIIRLIRLIRTACETHSR